MTIVTPLKKMPKPSSVYGQRKDPVNGKQSFHYGLDLPVAAGTEVFAVAEGVVTESRMSSALDGGYGQYIIITHKGGAQTAYAHMLDGSRLVNKGDRVTAGQQIGQVGATGHATGNHLHFEVRIGGKPVNPAAWLETYSTPQKPSKAHVEPVEAPTHPETPTAPAKPSVVRYTVKAGDTLTAIARKYKTTAAAIAKTNDITDVNLIHPGQKLTINRK